MEAFLIEHPSRHPSNKGGETRERDWLVILIHENCCVPQHRTILSTFNRCSLNSDVSFLAAVLTYMMTPAVRTTAGDRYVP